MGVDFYKTLQVDKNAKDDDLKKAYKKLTMKISEAYDVLSDPQKRAIYDQYGEEGLKGRPDGGATYHSTGDGPSSFRFNAWNPEDIFGNSSPSAGAGSSSGGMRGKNADNIFAEFFGGERGGSIGGDGGGTTTRKAAPIENKLPCSLEDLYNGTTKKMKISREITYINGKTSKTVQVEEILTIDLKRGWKKGTKITFPEKGNEQPNVIPADLVFVIDEKPHSVFTRDGDDLIVTQKILLVEALTGYTVRLTTLDGRNLTIPITDMIHPTYEEVVPREGMPLQKDPSRKGNLRIKFNINFRTRLTPDQKAGIKRLLGA